MANSTKTFVAEISISEGVEVLESTVGPSTVRTVDSDQISCYSAKVLGTNTQKTTSLTAPRRFLVAVLTNKGLFPVKNTYSDRIAYEYYDRMVKDGHRFVWVLDSHDTDGVAITATKA